MRFRGQNPKVFNRQPFNELILSNMEKIINDLNSLIPLLKTELQREGSLFPFYQLKRTLLVLSSIRNDIISKSYDKNLLQDLDAIEHWSIDSWPWDSLITKKTWSIIEEYNKIKK
jgi:hypothetical protein